MSRRNPNVIPTIAAVSAAAFLGGGGVAKANQVASARDGQRVLNEAGQLVEAFSRQQPAGALVQRFREPNGTYTRVVSGSYTEKGQVISYGADEFYRKDRQGSKHILEVIINERTAPQDSPAQDSTAGTSATYIFDRLPSHNVTAVEYLQNHYTDGQQETYQTTTGRGATTYLLGKMVCQADQVLSQVTRHAIPTQPRPVTHQTPDGQLDPNLFSWG